MDKRWLIDEQNFYGLSITNWCHWLLIDYLLVTHRLLIDYIERFPIECRKTKTKVIT